MSSQRYVDVILPLPLYSSFTYSVPEEIEGEIQTGSRVLVQFGKKKYYTGIVEALHSNEPKGYEVKPVVALLDPEPILRYPQLKFWKWISDYYLCSPGEVYKAAVPTGLKPESETRISLNPDYEADEKHSLKLTEQQALVIMTLQEHLRMRVDELEGETGLKNVAKVIMPMLDAGILEIDERVAERYRPKKITVVSLNFERNNEQKLHESFDAVKRSQLQEKALLSYLDLSGWLNLNSKLRMVSKQQLLETAKVSPAVIKGMVDKGILKIEKKTVNRFDSLSEIQEEIDLPVLSEPQQRAFQEIDRGFRENSIQLLHGVTGSGKTEIYTHLMAKAMEAGNQVLFLVPEISLTTQLSDRLRKIFGHRLLVYHSKFSDSERVDIWRRLLTSNEPLVVVGARSSIFLPFARLGLVVVDEEHEASFKQYDPAPRYNARDAALMLARMHGAKSLLGSATPAVETYFKAIEGKYGLVKLPERYEGSVLPDVEILDMKELRKKKEASGIISTPLRDRIIRTLQNKRQVILFQNRRGFAPVVICEQCGWTPKCANCDVSMVYHKNLGMLRCHYCGYSTLLPSLCPACGLNGLKIFGYGTERIAEEVKEAFPDNNIARMDLDTTRNKDAYQNIIEDFAHHDTEILIGTQMVSKGLDFGDVATVGVLNADTLLNFPDFRSNERAFNMLEQVAGRAGRRREKGMVLIQTLNPKHEILKHVRNHDYEGYYSNEIMERRKYAYPPFTKIINIYIRNKNPQMCDKAAVDFTLALRKVFGDRVLGPEKPYVSRIASYYIQSIMLKMESGVSMKKVKEILRQVYAGIAQNIEMKSSVVHYDVDPV
ncbi:MAG: primosomal protein N' [Muribaculaceae bacterium]|nr:primosomal protein N' [Muribaculaceae bacterium]